MQAENSRTGNFFSRLTLALEHAGKKPADLAAGTGVAISSYYRWREGHPPQERTVCALAAFLGVSAEWLLSGSGAMFADSPLATERLRDAGTVLGQEDFRELLEMMISIGDANAIRSHLSGLAEKIGAGDYHAAASLNTLLVMVRRLRPEILGTQTVSYTRSKHEPETDL